MTVAELIEALQRCDQSAPVLYCCDADEPVEEVFTMFAGVVLLMRRDAAINAARALLEKSNV